MPLNGEELMIQKESERKQYARPTKEQLEIVSLEEQLNVTRNLNDELENIIDKQKSKLDRINGAIDLFLKGDRFEGVTLDTIINVMEWKR